MLLSLVPSLTMPLAGLTLLSVLPSVGTTSM